MRFFEYESRAIVAKAGIPVTKHGFATTTGEAKTIAEEIGGPVVIKSQVLTGGRMKAGGVQFADTPADAAVQAKHVLALEINGHMPRGVLVDSRAAVRHEYYAGVVWDGLRKLPVMLFSDMGGTERGPVFFTEYGEQKAAIKLIPANPQNADSQLARWALAANLTHPHLLRMFQTGRCQVGGGRMVYAVTECADEDLSQIIPQRALSPAETREMLRPVLEALAYLHGKGLVHGHVKPANILAVGEELKISSAVSAASRACTTRPRSEREGALRREMFGRWA